MEITAKSLIPSPHAPPSSPYQGEEKSRKWLSFYVASQLYGINIDKIIDLLPLPEVTPVPLAPDFVLGIMNLRGRIVTVMDFTKIMHPDLIPPHKPKKPMNIVMEYDGKLQGFVVDELGEVISLAPHQITPLHFNIIFNPEWKGMIQGAYPINHETMILIDVDYFF